MSLNFQYNNALEACLWNDWGEWGNCTTVVKDNVRQCRKQRRRDLLPWSRTDESCNSPDNYSITELCDDDECDGQREYYITRYSF